jgi:hypothetical protein
LLAWMSNLFNAMTREKTRLFLMNVDLKDTMRSLNSPALEPLNATTRWKENSKLSLEEFEQC